MTAVTGAAPLSHILVCGTGLAAAMTVAALARALPSATRLTWIEAGDAAAHDGFYGTVTGPSAYAFNLAAGVEEPALMLTSDTAFSWGTRYAGWGAASWTQCFALPFPVIEGVVFHHHLAPSGDRAIEPYLIAAAAAARGAFAHPPRAAGETGQHPLARAEYGYQFDGADYARLFVAALPPGRVERLAGEVVGVDIADDAVTALRLADGRTLAADLFADCTGPAAMLLSRLEPGFERTRRIGLTTVEMAGRSNVPLRTLAATRSGWRSDTPLHGRVVRQSVHHPDDGGTVIALGRRTRAWAGNCIGIGHAACVAEPVTPSPMLLLERDIERLLSLLPNAAGMNAERREYNRRFDDDTGHAALFDRALFLADGLPDAPYWHAARAAPVAEKLARKIDMFDRRGLLVAYDLEPYHPEDWTILHLGMGRRPARRDRLADRAPADRVAAMLTAMRRDIEKAAAALPPADTYRTQFMAYLKRQRA